MDMRETVFEYSFKVLQKSGLGSALSPLTRGCGAIFMLHHVREPSEAAFQPNGHLEITPDFLEKAVKRIRDNGYEIISMDEAVDLLKTGYGRERYAVLTFDDGYRDNLEVAYPVLRALNAPFTIYVATGYLDRTAELWWVVLEKLIAENDVLEFSDTGPAGGVPCGTLAEKQACFETMRTWLTLEVTEEEQRLLIRELADRYGVDMSAITDKAFMTWDELRELSNDPLVTIGAHTHNHHALARLSDADAREDVDRGIERLEQELGRRPKHFAFPYGYASAVCNRDARYIEEIGLASSVTTFPGVLKSVNAREPWLLPRVSLNGRFQDIHVIDQYLTGAPFALYRGAKWLKSGFGLRSGFSRLFPSTR